MAQRRSRKGDSRDDGSLTSSISASAMDSMPRARDAEPGDNRRMRRHGGGSLAWIAAFGRSLHIHEARAGAARAGRTERGARSRPLAYPEGASGGRTTTITL